MRQTTLRGDFATETQRARSKEQAGRFLGSLLLGLYDPEGLLHHVGFTSSIAADRPALTKKLERLIEAPGFTGSAPDGPSRWNRGKEKPWLPLKPKLVVEVCFDHLTAKRFRHGTKLLRWRPDKEPHACTWEGVLPRPQPGGPTVESLLSS